MNTKEINIISLAYLGDAVYELQIREFLIKKGIAKVDELMKESVKYVSAKNQCRILTNLLDNNLLTENEKDIVNRGRNYKRASHPKNTDIITYKLSTGFEALIGYLYLENSPRLVTIMNYIMEENNEKNNSFNN